MKKSTPCLEPEDIELCLSGHLPPAELDAKEGFFTDFSGWFQHGLSFSLPQKNRMRVR